MIWALLQASTSTLRNAETVNERMARLEETNARLLEANTLSMSANAEALAKLEATMSRLGVNNQTPATSPSPNASDEPASR